MKEVIHENGLENVALKRLVFMKLLNFVVNYIQFLKKVN